MEHLRVGDLVIAVDQRQPVGRAQGVKPDEAREANHYLNHPKSLRRWSHRRSDRIVRAPRPGRLDVEVPPICPTDARARCAGACSLACKGRIACCRPCWSLAGWGARTGKRRKYPAAPAI